MTAYVLRRLLLMLPVAFLVTVGVFLLIHLSPGDPALIILGEDRSPQAIAQIHQELGLDKPLYVQYVIWLGHIGHGDWGRSITTHQPVATAITERLPATLELGLTALLWPLLVAVVTIIGLQIGGIIEGAVVTETVFTWPGVGRLAVESIFNRDYTVVQGIVLLAAFSYMVANLLVDLAYAWLDPRISYA